MREGWAMSRYLSSEAICWAAGQLSRLPKNQTALLYFLILARAPEVVQASLGRGTTFEKEFYRYFGAPIKGGGTACFDPFAGEWRAEDYIFSTVYGRLLNGSHRWTTLSGGFFRRLPSEGWPAKFHLEDEGFDVLKFRSSPPCLKYGMRLPLLATAVHYYRWKNLGDGGPKDELGLVELYRQEVISLHPRLQELFVDSATFPGPLFRDHPQTEQEAEACYPPSQASSESKKNELLYESDILRIKAMASPGETPADTIRRFIAHHDQETQ